MRSAAIISLWLLMLLSIEWVRSYWWWDSFAVGGTSTRLMIGIRSGGVDVGRARVYRNAKFAGGTGFVSGRVANNPLVPPQFDFAGFRYTHIVMPGLMEQSVVVVPLWFVALGLLIAPTLWWRRRKAGSGFAVVVMTVGSEGDQPLKSSGNQFHHG